jgi:hypothetical protein
MRYPFCWDVNAPHTRRMDSSFTPPQKLRTHTICKHLDCRMITTGKGMSVWKMEPPHQYHKPRYLQVINIDYKMFKQQNELNHLLRITQLKMAFNIPQHNVEMTCNTTI